MGESYPLRTPKEEFEHQLNRQFGKKDGAFFALNPEKFKHHFDPETLKAYEEIKRQEERQS